MMKFKHDNKTARMLIRLAQQLGIQPHRTWKYELAKKLNVTNSNVLSNWVARERGAIPEVYQAIERYNLNSAAVLYDDGQAPTPTVHGDTGDAESVDHLQDDICLTKQAAETWPELSIIIYVANKATTRSMEDLKFILLTMQHVSDRLSQRLTCHNVPPKSSQPEK